jgi:hypothetical protein
MSHVWSEVNRAADLDSRAPPPPRPRALAGTAGGSFGAEVGRDSYRFIR